ncbi:MAG: CRTAC1 family protein [bacterium]|nr:CRTAC1 family protein [bacterium]
MNRGHRHRAWQLFAALLVVAAGCGGESGSGGPEPPAASADSSLPGSAPARPNREPEEIFVERAATVGVEFHHFNGMSGGNYMVEVISGGGALFDYDNDGDLDLYLVQSTILGPGTTLDDALFPPRRPSPLVDRLYRNDLEVAADGTRTLRFTDVTAESGLEADGYGVGATAADYDNDGWLDLYVTNFGPNQLWKNNGGDADGRVTFRDVTAESGTGDPGWGVPAVFFDYDRDGWLDLYVGNYVEFVWGRLPTCNDLTGAIDYCGPGSFPPGVNPLYHSRGDGTFEEVTRPAGLLAEPQQPTLGAVAGDLNGDRWPDLYVANDAKPNNLWINQQDGTFKDEALFAGCSVNVDGQPQASMGVDIADFDDDGDLDLFMTHIRKETNTLYINDGRGLFDDRSVASGLGPRSQPATSFGTRWFDYDNDGLLDLLTVSGTVTKIIPLVRRGDPYPLHQTNQLFHNDGNGRYVEVTDVAGEVFTLSEVSRAAILGDVDNDGDSDVVVVNNNGPARLLINRVGQRRHWLGLRLVAGDPPRDALGTRVEVVRRGRPSRWRWVRVAGSYCSSGDPRILVGLGDLGDQPAVDLVRAWWPDGTVEQWDEVAVDGYTTLRRGSGRPE